MNTFNIKKSADSYYIKYNKVMDYTISSEAIETDNTAALVEAILQEFAHSSPAEIAQFRPVLEAWLAESKAAQVLVSEQDLLSKESSKVLDNIYEMF